MQAPQPAASEEAAIFLDVPSHQGVADPELLASIMDAEETLTYPPYGHTSVPYLPYGSCHDLAALCPSDRAMELVWENSLQNRHHTNDEILIPFNVVDIITEYNVNILHERYRYVIFKSYLLPS